MRRIGIIVGIAATVLLGGMGVAQSTGPAGDVVIANAYAPADALTGGPLASRLSAPLMTVRVDEVPPATHRQLEALQPARIILLGGPVVISGNVETELRDLSWDPTVVRLGGGDRFETAELIADFLGDQPLPAAGSLEGATLDDLVTNDDLADHLGATTDPIEQVQPVPTTNGERNVGKWVTTGVVRSRLVCEPDIGSGLPEAVGYVELEWLGDGEGDLDPFSRSSAYINGSDPSDIQSLVSGMTGVDGSDVVQATAEGWVSINIHTADACHGVWTIRTHQLPTAGN